MFWGPVLRIQSLTGISRESGFYWVNRVIHQKLIWLVSCSLINLMFWDLGFPANSTARVRAFQTCIFKGFLTNINNLVPRMIIGGSDSDLRYFDWFEILYLEYSRFLTTKSCFYVRFTVAEISVFFDNPVRNNFDGYPKKHVLGACRHGGKSDVHKIAFIPNEIKILYLIISYRMVNEVLFVTLENKKIIILYFSCCWKNGS